MFRISHKIKESLIVCVTWVFFQGKRKPSPNKPFSLQPDFLPRFGGYGVSMEHWMAVIVHRPTRCFFWPECTIGQVKIIMSCFLDDVAPGNMKIEVERTTAESNERKESSTTFVELDDNNLTLAELPEGQCKYRYMKVNVRKKRIRIFGIPIGCLENAVLTTRRYRKFQKSAWRMPE
jgi:hypothetical protein